MKKSSKITNIDERTIKNVYVDGLFENITLKILIF